MNEGKGYGVNHSWTDPVVARLRALHAEGLSCSQAAAKLNEEFGTALTRNAVIGKLTRLGVSWGAPSAPRTKPQKFNTVTVAKIAKARAAVKPSRASLGTGAVLGPGHTPVIKPPTPYVERPEAAGKVTMLELEAHHCRWPVGDPSSDTFRHCGDRQQDGSPYCPAHHRRAYVKPPTPPKELARSLRRYVA